MSRHSGWARVFGWGVLPGWATLEVMGREAGEVSELPITVVRVHHERYVVSTLVDDAAWVDDVRAAGGQAVLHHGRRQAVELVEVAAAERTAVLRALLATAHGGLPHLDVDPLAPEAALSTAASTVTMFKVATADERATA